MSVGGTQRLAPGASREAVPAREEQLPTLPPPARRRDDELVRGPFSAMSPPSLKRTAGPGSRPAGNVLIQRPPS